jgi:LPXTG-motif cell wall-anchored protein
MAAGLWITAIILIANKELGETGTWIYVGLTSALTLGLILTRKKKEKSESSDKK